MIRVSRSKIINKLRSVAISNYGSEKQLVNDAMHGDGLTTMAFLVKKRKIKIPDQELLKELDHMVEKSLLTIGQWESMRELVLNSQTGNERITNFLRRKRRITIV